MADDSREVEATSQAQEATEEAGAGGVALEVDRLYWILGQLMEAIPQKRDWLDPALEEEAHEALRAYRIKKNGSSTSRSGSDADDLQFLRFLERYAPETMRSWRCTYERFGREHLSKTAL